VSPRTADISARRVLPWRFLTGRTEAGLAPMLTAFGQRVDKDRDSERLSHLLRMYLVDATGRIRNIYGLGTIDPRLIMADVATLLLEGAGR
jgi:protein SCO1/2